jgi:hypothetical protein
MAEDTFIDAIKRFRKLPHVEREKIVVALESASPAMNLRALAEEIAVKNAIEEPFLAGLLEWLGGFVAQAIAQPSFANEFADYVARWLDSQTKGEKPSDPSFKSQLCRLLKAERSIGVTSKAQVVMWGHGKVFRDAHLITQIRPIVLRDLSADPENAVVIHELKLDYREGEADASICINMDRRQVVQLKDILQRALDKEDGLRKNRKFKYLPGR